MKKLLHWILSLSLACLPMVMPTMSVNAEETDASIKPRTFTTEKQTDAVDKSALQNLYDTYRTYTPTYMDDTSSTFKKLVSELDTTQQLLAKEDATAEEIANQAIVLECRYWATKVEDHTYHYSPTRNNFDYQLYTTDSIKPLLKAYYTAKINNYNTTAEQTELYKQMDAAFAQAKDGVVLAEGKTNVSVGFDVDRYKYNTRGAWTIEQVNENNRIYLQVRYENNGINPITDQDVKKFSASDMRSAYFDLYYFDETGDFIAIIPVTLSPIDGNASLGYEGMLDIQQLLDDAHYDGDKVPVTFCMDIRFGGDRYYSQGFYRISYAVDSDKEALQLLYDEVHTYLPTYLPDDWHTYDFKKAIETANAVLADERADQAMVDQAHDALLARYWSVKAQDKLYQYDPAKENFDFHPYTTESILPLILHVYDTMEGTFGGSTAEHAQKYKMIYDTFVQLEEKLVSAEGKEGLFVDLSKDALRSSTKQGHFTVTETRFVEDNVAKSELRITFVNDGMHPVTGKVKQVFTAEDMEKGFIQVRRYDDEGNFVRSDSIMPKDLLPLDGETTKEKGVQAIFVAEDGEYFFTFESNYSEVFQPGAYRTQDRVTIVKDALKNSMEEASKIDRSLYTQASLAAFDDAFAVAQRIYEDSTMTQAQVEEAQTALQEAMKALEYRKADYTKVEQWIALANQIDRSKYTEESLKVLDAALRQVEKDLNITQQARVDLMAQAIYEAMHALKEKEIEKETPTITQPETSPSDPTHSASVSSGGVNTGMREMATVYGFGVLVGMLCLKMMRSYKMRNKEKDA